MGTQTDLLKKWRRAAAPVVEVSNELRSDSGVPEIKHVSDCAQMHNYHLRNGLHSGLYISPLRSEKGKEICHTFTGYQRGHRLPTASSRELEFCIMGVA